MQLSLSFDMLNSLLLIALLVSMRLDVLITLQWKQFVAGAVGPELFTFTSFLFSFSLFFFSVSLWITPSGSTRTLWYVLMFARGFIAPHITATKV